jgi:hypothetical protein
MMGTTRLDVLSLAKGEARTSRETGMTQLAAASPTKVRKKPLGFGGRVRVMRGSDNLGFAVVVRGTRWRWRNRGLEGDRGRWRIAGGGGSSRTAWQDGGAGSHRWREQVVAARVLTG